MEGNALLRALAKAFVDALKSSGTDSEPSEPVLQLDLPVVRIAYGALTEPVPDNGPEGRYVYYWPFPKPPAVGERVIVPTWKEPENHAVVTGLGTAEDANGAQILTITRLATDEEVDAARNEMFEAQRKREADMRAWLAIAQRLAGFPPGSTGTPPDEYPYTPISPIDDTTPCRTPPKECGFVWRRVHRRAEEYGLPDDQVKRFKRISDRWFDIALGRPVRDL
ncbi:MAG: hypothetical protein M3Y90_08150 [Actinomycetota bacterium]|nr:hypothetical protein [Actinomycetota bacterium]